MIQSGPIRAALSMLRWVPSYDMSPSRQTGENQQAATGWAVHDIWLPRIDLDIPEYWSAAARSATSAAACIAIRAIVSRAGQLSTLYGLLLLLY